MTPDQERMLAASIVVLILLAGMLMIGIGVLGIVWLGEIVITLITTTLPGLWTHSQ